DGLGEQSSVSPADKGRERDQRLQLDHGRDRWSFPTGDAEFGPHPPRDVGGCGLKLFGQLGGVGVHNVMPKSAATSRRRSTGCRVDSWTHVIASMSSVCVGCMAARSCTWWLPGPSSVAA